MAAKKEADKDKDKESAGESEKPAPIIIKKHIGGHGGGHGGAWKIALADMMTAMMAFFLLMWLLGSTNTDARKSIADYFKQTPLLKMGNNAGSNGVFGGRSMISPEGLPDSINQTSVANVMPPTQATGGNDRDEGPAGSQSPDGKSKEGEGRAGMAKGPAEGGVVDDAELGAQGSDATVQEGQPKRGESASTKSAGGVSDDAAKKAAAEVDQKNFDALQAQVSEALSKDATLSKIADQVQFVKVKDGLRIEIVDKADFSMFSVGTTRVLPRASALIGELAKAISELPNQVVIRGHTDSLAYALDSEMNNWLLSAERAESTRQLLQKAGVPEGQIARVEGVADTEPYNPKDALDIRNRRISMTLLFRDGEKAAPNLTGAIQ
ncbi:MAG: flagellar motor protein [Alphaproteobacteria bacterium]|jgi:chemotaxis protein MotB|nr:flagellar motor protein [Alphaproteobacteria bacterium]